MEEDDDNKEIGGGFRFNLHKRPLSKNSHANPTNKVNSNLKHMPAHLASKIVDDILNHKFSKD